MTMSSLRSNSLLPQPVFSAASISGTTGSPSTGSFTDGDGFTWSYYRFTASGSITVSQAGYGDVLVVGSGGGGQASSFNVGGGAGAVRYGMFWLGIATYTVTIGSGGSTASNGNPSSMGSLLRAGGGQAAYAASGAGSNYARSGNGGGGSPGGYQYGIGSGGANGGGAGGTSYGASEYSGISLNYANASVEYGIGGYTGTTGAANTGNAGFANNAGGSGIVIVRVRTN